MERSFSEDFSWLMGDTFLWVNLLEAVLNGGLMIVSYKGKGSFTNAFSSNLKAVNVKIFANHKRMYT